jgi:bifunctional pyridoxal-dependent enzyme with beta-cystathionase and maltose regulon repressor activities
VTLADLLMREAGKTALSAAHVKIANVLCDLEKLFKPEMRLTFIARHPTNPECHIVVTRDDMGELAKLCERKK